MDLYPPNNSNNFETKFSCKSYLINKNITQGQLTNCLNIIDDKEKNMIKNLIFVINLYKEYAALNNKINILNNNHNQSNSILPSNNDFFLIDANYLNEVESSICFQEISNILNTKEVFDINLIKDNNISPELLGKIKGKLSQNTIIVLRENSEEKLQNKLFNISKLSLSLISDNNHNKYYFSNCKIINNLIVNLLMKIDKNISPKIKNINSIFDKGKIIIKTDDLINIGFLTDKKEFIVEYIIQTNYDINSLLIEQIFNDFKTFGYKFLEHFDLFDYKNYKFQNKLIEIKINKLIVNDSYSGVFDISNKLKALILLSICKIKENSSINSKKDGLINKIFLINISWLLNYKYDQIYYLIKNNIEILKLVENYDISYLINNQVFNNIISKIGPQEIKQIDGYISNLNSTVPLQPNSDIINLHDQKKIKIFKDFLLINEKIYHYLLHKNFDSLNNILHTIYLHKNGDVIIISDNNQNTLIFGTTMDISFKINYILEYKISNIIEKELKYISTYGEEEYIKHKTVFNVNNNNDFISPIFSENDIIGYCYKYYPNIDYSKCFNYLNYLTNEKILKAFNLYRIYKEILKKIRESGYYFQKEKFFLVNKNIATKIKKDYNYEEFKKKFDETLNHISAKNPNINYDKMLLSIIKNMSNEELQFYFNSPGIINKYNKSLMEPDIIPLNKNEQGNPIMIYDNFEIFSLKAMNLFIDGINGNENNCLKCYLVEGKIIINYPFNKHGNKRYVCVLGSLNDENTFIKEYILIYNDENEHIYHMNKINGKLINYLNTLQLYNNSQPITNGKFEEIGIIIKVGNNNEDINYNYNQVTNKKTNNNSNLNKQFNNFGFEPSDIYDIDYNDWNTNYNINDNDYVKESEYNLEYKTNTPFIKDNFPLPPLIGLRNIGATCYMNATLQCFCHIEKFINFFKYSHQPIDIVKKDKKTLTSSFKLLIEHLWPNNYNKSTSKKYYVPKEFKNKISKMNPLFKGVAANDAKDLVNFIIMTLHEELNKVGKKAINSSLFNLDQTNSQIMFKNYANNFMQQNQSIISDLFY